MAASKKTSITSSSAKTRRNRTAAPANISKSAKENTGTATVTQATMRSSTMKKTTASNRLVKPAAKPLQARTQDTEMAALLAKVAAQEGLSKDFC
jgi:hypothetical protein